MNQRGEPPSRMGAARRALALLAPCGANARTTGSPCKRPPCRGSTRCHLHGGRSTGPAPTSGRRTYDRQRNGHFATVMLAVLNDMHGHEKPPPIDINDE